MKITQIGDVIQKFCCNNSRVILIDGPWGVGKTYQLLQFLKKEAKDKREGKSVYVSLFGKGSIDEIHTEIYTKFHPAKSKAKKVLQLIPKVAPLFGTAGQIVANMEYALKADQKHLSQITKEAEAIMDCARSVNEVFQDDLANGFVKSKSNSSKKSWNLIILDDLERLNFEKISLVDILGYINDLVLQNLKVVIICNSEKIVSDESLKQQFDDFREKVFDREYKITATNKEIIDSYFGEDARWLDDYIRDEFNENLRVAQRVSDFFVETVSFLQNCNSDFEKRMSKAVLIKYCAVVVVGAATRKYEVNYTNGRKEEADRTNSIDYICAKDTFLALKMKHIQFYLRNSDLFPSQNIDISFLIALAKKYYYDDENELVMLFAPPSKDRKKAVTERALYLSDAGKKKLFERQFEFLNECEDFSNVRLQDMICDMYHYPDHSRINDREDELIKILVKNRTQLEGFIGDGVFRSFCENEQERTFYQKVREAFVEAFVGDWVEFITSAWKEKNYALLYQLLIEMRHKGYNLDDRGQKLNPAILNMIRSNQYFIGNLFEEIESVQWEIAHSICTMSKNFGFVQELVDYISGIDCKQDQSAKRRYSVLQDVLSEK